MVFRSARERLFWSRQGWVRFRSAGTWICFWLPIEMKDEKGITKSAVGWRVRRLISLVLLPPTAAERISPFPLPTLSVTLNS